VNALTRDIAHRLRMGADVLTVAKQPLPGMTGAQTRAFVGRIADEVFNLGVDTQSSGQAPDTPRLHLYLEGATDSQIARTEGVGVEAVRIWRKRYALDANGAVREMAPCGTDAAYRRHQRKKEKPCQRCAEAATLAKAMRNESRKRSRRAS
jgi:hypothetical protein